MSLQISIDGRSLSAEKGKTVLQVARENGIEIPTLCDFPGLPSHGSCRMCIVEIQGRPNTPTACTTLVEEGMVVQTHSPVVQSLRKELLKLLLSEHPSSCLFCPEHSHCEDCMVTLRKSGVEAMRSRSRVSCQVTLTLPPRPASRSRPVSHPAARSGRSAGLPV